MNRPGRVYLVRHPETDWNTQGRFQGRTGRPLTDRGRACVATLVDLLKNETPARVVSSPADHAIAAAAPIAAAVSCGAEPVIDPAWSEIDHGLWEGLTYDEVVARFGTDARRRFDDPLDYDGHAGETLRAAGSRVARAWEAVTESAGATIVVSHATPIRLVLCRCLDLPATRQWCFRIDNGGVTGISIADGAVTLDFTNHRTQT